MKNKKAKEYIDIIRMLTQKGYPLTSAGFIALSVVVDGNTLKDNIPDFNRAK